MPSVRLAAYVGLGAALWIVAAIIPEFHAVAGLYDLFLVVCALADLAFSPQVREFEIWRHFDPKMNLGASNLVHLHVRSRARIPVNMVIRDEPPVGWPISTDEPRLERDGVPLPVLPRAKFKLAAGREEAGQYHLKPTRRGDYRFGPLQARYGTGLGLWYRQFSVQPDDENSVARVYPDTSEVRRYELALRDGKLRDVGLHILRLRGRGTEFESLRDYTTDDEYKSIDWKASARRGKLIATNYEIERDQTVVICIDCGRMMTSMAVSRPVRGTRGGLDPVAAAHAAAEHAQAAGTQGQDESVLVAQTPLSKLDCAINATVLLSHVASSMGDSVGLLLFSDSVLKFIPPRKGKVQTGAIIEALYAAQPSLVEPDYQAAYEYLMARKVRRSLVVTFTDIIDPEASRELLNASGAIRRHHNALCVTINNRDVIDLAASYPNSSSDLYHKAMAQRMLSQRLAALERLRAHGVGILDVEASQLTISTVNRYLDLKSRGAM